MTKMSTKQREENLHRPVPAVLLTEEGQKLCSAMRREAWFTLMASSTDPTMRRLGAAIFVAAAMNDLVPSRAAWGAKPTCALCGQSCGNNRRCANARENKRTEAYA